MAAAASAIEATAAATSAAESATAADEHLQGSQVEQLEQPIS